MTTTEAILLAVVVLLIVAFATREALTARRAAAADVTALRAYIGTEVQISAAGKEWQGTLVAVGADHALLADPSLGSSGVLDSRLLLPLQAITHVQVAKEVFR